MRLKTLTSALREPPVNRFGDADIADLAYDSRAVTPGSLFVAVPSVRAAAMGGGNRYVESAVERGASAVVTESEKCTPNVPTVRVRNARAALADLAAAFFGYPSRDLRAYAVTGTDGKTTTTYLLNGILAACGYTTGVIGTIETRIGPMRIPNDDRVTTPESLDLQRTLRRMVNAGVTHVSLEASSHALSLDRLRGTRFAACALTNITGDHVEYHGSWEAYVQSKFSLFTAFGNETPAILNKDDGSYDALASLVGSRAVSYSCTQDADVRATDIQPVPRGNTFNLSIATETVPVALPLAGQFNVSNALAAAGLAASAGIPLADIAYGLASAPRPPGRMEHVECGQPFDVVVDYGHTVHAFRSVLAALRADASPSAKLIAVFGAAGGRDHAKRPLFGTIARQYTDFFIITNEDPCDEDPAEIMAEVAAGVPAGDEGHSYVRELDRHRAIERACERARPGDVVVILGKGHEHSIVAGETRLPWNDVEVVRSVLAGHR